MGRHGRLIALEGRSASGKTTLVQAAARSLGWVPLAEAFDRLDPAPSLEFRSVAELLRIEGTLLAEESRRYHEARELCSRGRTVLADTGFLGPVTYTFGLVDLGVVPASVRSPIERSARSLVRRGHLGIPDLTVYLDTTVRERGRRAQADPVHHPSALVRRHEAVGAFEQRYFANAFPVSMPGRFESLRARSVPRSLVKELRGLVEERAPLPASRSEALSLLALLRTRRESAPKRAGVPNR